MKSMKAFEKSLLLAACLVFAAQSNCGSFSSSYPVRCAEVCADLGKQCGTWMNECQERLECGDCGGGLTCRDDGKCVESCESLTCEQLDIECGSWSDGCGLMQDCGDCTIDQICDATGRCVDGRITQEDRVSECGGFEAAGGSLFKGPRAEYCDAEMLHWEYDAAGPTLRLADARVFLNCCGEHSMTVEEQDGVYVFTEVDAVGIGRCLCMCVFDFVIEVQGVESATIPIRIERVVTDWPDGSGLVYEGELDLAQGSGSDVIDDTAVEGFCP